MIKPHIAALLAGASLLAWPGSALAAGTAHASRLAPSVEVHMDALNLLRSQPQNPAAPVAPPPMAVAAPTATPSNSMAQPAPSVSSIPFEVKPKSAYQNAPRINPARPNPAPENGPQTAAGAEIRKIPYQNRYAAPDAPTPVAPPAMMPEGKPLAVMPWRDPSETPSTPLDLPPPALPYQSAPQPLTAPLMPPVAQVSQEPLEQPATQPLPGSPSLPAAEVTPVAPVQAPAHSSWMDDTTNFFTGLFDSDETPPVIEETQPPPPPPPPAPSIEPAATPVPSAEPAPMPPFILQTEQPSAPMAPPITPPVAAPITTPAQPPSLAATAPSVPPQTTQPKAAGNAARYDGYEMSQSFEPLPLPGLAPQDDAPLLLDNQPLPTPATPEMEMLLGEVSANNDPSATSAVTSPPTAPQVLTIPAAPASPQLPPVPAAPQQASEQTTEQPTEQNTLPPPVAAEPAPSESKPWFDGLKQELNAYFSDEEQAQQESKQAMDDVAPVIAPPAQTSANNAEPFLAPPPVMPQAPAPQTTTAAAEMPAAPANPLPLPVPLAQNQVEKHTENKAPQPPVAQVPTATTAPTPLPTPAPVKDTISQAAPSLAVQEKTMPNVTSRNVAEGEKKLVIAAPAAAPTETKKSPEKSAPEKTAPKSAQKPMVKDAEKPAATLAPTEQAPAPIPAPVVAEKKIVIEPQTKPAQANTAEAKTAEIKAETTAPQAVAIKKPEAAPAPTPAQPATPTKEVVLTREPASEQTAATEKTTQTASLPPQAPAAAPPSALNLTFTDAETELSTEAKEKLNAIAAQMKTSESTRLFIKGYAAADKEQEVLARRIALARGLAVRAYLIDQGVGALRINVQSVGNANGAATPNQVTLEVRDSSAS